MQLCDVGDNRIGRFCRHILWRCGHSGAINLSDLITLNKFLAGKGVLQHEAAADVNANGVIDAVDVEILSRFLGHIVAELPYTG